MATSPIIHIYHEINIGKYATVKHFELKETLNGSSELSPLLNIADNRNFAFSKPIYWVKERREGTWIKPHLTGLFETRGKNLFWGDANHKKHLLLFKFDEIKNRLIVFYFKNDFSNDLSGFIKRANSLYNKQKRMV